MVGSNELNLKMDLMRGFTRRHTLYHTFSQAHGLPLVTSLAQHNMSILCINANAKTAQI